MSEYQQLRESIRDALLAAARALDNPPPKADREMALEARVKELEEEIRDLAEHYERSH